MLLAVELDRYSLNGGHVSGIGHPIIGATATEGYHVLPLPNEELATNLPHPETHRNLSAPLRLPPSALASGKLHLRHAAPPSQVHE
jgi:hypothetical protein